MAKVTIQSTVGFDANDLDVSGLLEGDSYYRSSSVLKVSYNDENAYDLFKGLNFRYNGNGEPTSGRVTLKNARNGR